MPVHVPTDEELRNWQPDPAQKRYRIELNVATGETKRIELTLEEYRQRHRAKMISQNEREARDLDEQQKEERERVLEWLIQDAIQSGKVSDLAASKGRS